MPLARRSWRAGGRRIRGGDVKDTPASTNEGESFLLDQRRRLSRSLLWKLQREYFERQGIEAWRQGTIPQYITTNPFTANAYAQVVFGFLRDCHTAASITDNGGGTLLDFSQPVYIVELGAGSGRLAYHFLKAFTDILSRSALNAVPVCYVMTDFAQSTVDYWREHSSLHPFVEAGQLDFALFDAEQPGDLILLQSGNTLSPGTVKNPLVVIANYFFDSIPQDSFTIDSNHLYENLVTLSSPQFEPDLNNPELLGCIEISYALNPVTSDYYDEPDLNRILHSYQERLTDTTILFPTTALRCIRYLIEFSSERLLLLSGDKGYVRENSLLNLEAPWMNIHGSLSMLVNYHILAQYVLNRGGQVLQTSHQHTKLNVSAFLLGKHPSDYVETCQAFHEAIGKGGPDDFFALKKGIENHYGDLTLEQLLAWLRLSGWDADILLDSIPALLDKAKSASDSLKQELCCAIRQVWEMYYPINEKRDLAFHLGTLLQVMAFYTEALDYYRHSLRFYGSNLSTFYNMGSCHYNLGQLEAALGCINQALEMDPAFEDARVIRIKIQSEIGDQARANYH